MPISEDEYEHIHSSMSMHQPQVHAGGMSKAEQRRSNKPIMEKRRRARINHCLNELKSLILDAMKKDPARHSKLEKADILEMTVKHLQTIQRQQLSVAMTTDPAVIQKFKTGFNECAGEVSRYIGRMEGVETGVKQRLVAHLANCVTGLQQISPFTFPNTSNSLFSSSEQQSTILPTEDVNNNHASARLQMMTGLQLIPSRLPTGELALLLPNSQHIPGNVLPFFPPPQDSNHVSTTSDTSPNATVTSNTMERNHASAFTAVNREKFYSTSPLPSPSSTTASSYGDESSDQPYPSPNHLAEVTSSSDPKLKVPEENFLDYSKNCQKVYIQPGQTQSSAQIPSTHLKDISNNSSQTHTFQTFPSAPPVKNIQTPLTVITSNEMMKEFPQRYLDFRSQHPAASVRDPLDFSIRKDVSIQYPVGLKRPFSEDKTDKILMKSMDLEPSLKMSRLSSNFERQTDEAVDGRTVEEFSNRPSTSTSEVSRDMWRPW